MPTDKVEPNKLYTIKKSDLGTDYYKLISGISAGILTIPFKLRTDDGSLSGNSTLGGYVGYNQRWLGFNSVILGALGLATIATQNVNSTSPANKTGVTAAIGIAVPIEKTFQVGLIIGADHLGGQDGKAWGHDNKLWISAGIGYAFTQ